MLMANRNIDLYIEFFQYVYRRRKIPVTLGSLYHREYSDTIALSKSLSIVISVPKNNNELSYNATINDGNGLEPGLIYFTRSNDPYYVSGKFTKTFTLNISTSGKVQHDEIPYELIIRFGTLIIPFQMRSVEKNYHLQV